MPELLATYLAAEGASFALLALGVFIAFIWLRFPDLSPDGSFLIGAGCFAAAANSGMSVPIATCLGVVAGIVLGGWTAVMSVSWSVPPLVAGLITSLIAYSVAWQILGSPNQFLPPENTLFGGSASLRGATLFAGASLVLLLLAWLIGSYSATTWPVLRLRALGENPLLVADLGVSHLRYVACGLAAANGLAALAGSLAVQRTYSADVNMGAGVTLSGLVAVLFGNFLHKRSASVRIQLAATIAAAFTYKLLLFVLLRIGVPAELFRALSGILLVALFLAARSRSVVAGIRWT